MIIGGLQKLTLLDFPGKTACTVFTEGCNFRCPFCHNAALVKNKAGQIATEEIFSFLKKRQGLLDGVCITGGEPLLQADIEDFIYEIKSMGYAVKLDTNGSFPDRLIDIVGKGLCDYVAMDIKNSKSKYLATAGVTRDILSDIEKSVNFLLSGTVDYEFRTTVVDPYHDFSDFYEIGEWIKGAKNYFLQSFIDSGELLSDGMKAWKKEDMEAASLILQGFAPNVKIRGI